MVSPSSPSADSSAGTSPTDWVAVARALGPAFAARAAEHDATDSFVAQNYRELKEQRVFSAGVPAELCAMLRELGRYCGATALAVSMHTHLLATTMVRYRQGQPVTPLLERIAREQTVLVSTGASDWLDSSGSAERVDGGYRVTGRKIFGSGSPMGDLLITSAPYNDPTNGPVVLHFPVPIAAEGVSVQDNWRTMSMRGSGSNDVLLENAFVPEGAVSLTRPKGEWHPFFNIVVTVAVPIFMSAYVGVAEAARDLALQQVARKREDPDVWYLVGEMENALVTAQMAIDGAIGLCNNYDFTPDVATANAVLIRKTIAAESLIRTVEKALEVVGGGGLFRAMGLERLVRDIHGAQFHPLQAKRQHRFSGRAALGLDPAGG